MGRVALAALALSAFVVLVGCTTSRVQRETGEVVVQKKFLGIVPVPMTKAVEAPTPTTKAVAEFRVYHYMAAPLILFGLAFMIFTKAKTGIGVACAGGGLGLSAWATVMPRIAGAVTVILLVMLVGAGLYGAWLLLRRSRRVG